MIFLKSSKISLVLLLTITLCTTFFRYSIHSNNSIYQNYDATYHVLLTVEALKNTPISVHHLLPIVSLGQESDKNIKWGATIPDKYGNYYYTSFPPGGFIFPYLIFDVLHIESTVINLFVLNSFLLFLSVITIFLLTKKIDNVTFPSSNNSNLTAFIVGIIYIFSLETLYSHGFIYWGHSLMQPIFIYFLYTIFKILTEHNKSSYLYQTFILSFLLGFVEWSGYLIVFGAMIAFLFSDLENRIKYQYIFSCAIGGIFSLTVFLFAFLITVDSTTFFHALISRFFARNITSEIPFYLIFYRYWQSYNLFLFILPISIFLFFKWRNNNNVNNKHALKLLIIVIIFALIENIIMKQHAIAYHFDRLKLLPIFAIAVPLIFHSNNNFARYFMFFIVFSGSLYSLYEYPKLRIEKHIELTKNNIFLENKKFSKECLSCSLGIQWAVRGYTNLLFNKGVYENQSPSSLLELAKNQGNCACYVDSDDIKENMIKINGYKKLN